MGREFFREVFCGSFLGSFLGDFLLGFFEGGGRWKGVNTIFQFFSRNFEDADSAEVW